LPATWEQLPGVLVPLLHWATVHRFESSAQATVIVNATDVALSVAVKQALSPLVAFAQSTKLKTPHVDGAEYPNVKVGLVDSCGELWTTSVPLCQVVEPQPAALQACTEPFGAVNVPSVRSGSAAPGGVSACITKKPPAPPAGELNETWI
jgi:hypothetical protein